MGSFPQYEAALQRNREQELRNEIERLHSELAELKRACLDARVILGFGDLHPNAESVPIPRLIVECAREADAAFTEAERELAELRERIANGVVADVAEDTRHEGSSALVAAAEKVGYYEGYRVRLVRED